MDLQAAFVSTTGNGIPHIHASHAHQHHCVHTNAFPVVVQKIPSRTRLLMSLDSPDVNTSIPETVSNIPSSNGTASPSSTDAKEKGKEKEKETRKVEGVHPSWYIYQKPGNLCVICYGEGYEKCMFCYGKGHVVIGTSLERDTKPCPVCSGATKNLCTRCQGTGKRPDWIYSDDFKTKIPNKTNADVCKEMVFDPSMYQVTKEEMEAKAEEEKKK
eukprot:CAMPEP_0184693664 /NCGR_PEP_ID=MMETSP0313-20130426/1837_1 /TAXON_ID=2792 /ORGANISM="Porphyridium aerugineum, Strain SAG 1380-2" /LENGTH=214 /DNA_ID=CAMNT_0027151801 /DNA_START=99 /DNA_END=743 /DNA_ORIENTATION=+